jgi:hypothetical protein
LPPNALTIRRRTPRVLAQDGARGAIWRGIEQITAAVVAHGDPGIERIFDVRSKKHHNLHGATIDV